MRKILTALAVWLALAGAAAAQTCPAYPFTFTPNTTIRSAQVNSDFASILNCANTNLAPLASPSFTGTVTLANPLSASNGGSTIYIGGTSTGSANAQAVATLTPSGFALVAGNHVVFKAGFTNTGALTLNANSTGATAVDKMGTSGVTALVGLEVQSGATYEALFDGTEYVLVAPTTDPTVAIPTGVCLDYVGTSAPAGWVFANGQVLSAGGANTNLIALMGTTFGASGTTPDMRGRATFGVDNMGGIGAANRLGSNSSAGGFSGTVALGSAAGAQTHTPIVAEMFAHAHPGSTGSFTGNAITTFAGGTAGSTLAVGDNTTTNGSITPSGSVSVSIASQGSSTAFNITPPALVMNKICKL